VTTAAQKPYKEHYMNLYIKISFWLGIAGIVMRALTMMVSDYPRTVKHSLGEDVVTLIREIGFAVWAWVLIYG
jgi:hypothetical protein